MYSHLTTIADPWYFWKGIRTTKAHKPVTLLGNHTFTKSLDSGGKVVKPKKINFQPQKKNEDVFSF